MNPIRRLTIGLIVLGFGAVGFTTGRTVFRPDPPRKQAIAFDHKKHAGELEIDCETCHEYLSVGHHAGLPTLSTCLLCHEEPLTKEPEEQKIRDLAAKGQVDVFRKLFRLPEHVYYSHRRHAIVAKIPCATCHGAIAETTTPPDRPFVRIDMNFCIDCHKRESVSTDCTRCHH